MTSAQSHQLIHVSVDVSKVGRPVGYGSSLPPSHTLTIQQRSQQLLGIPFRGLFGPMSHCSLNISPNNFVVCVNCNLDSAVDKEYCMIALRILN